MAELSIGAAAKSTGIKVPTIRYYEEIGLVAPPPRTESGRRIFDLATVRRLIFIRHARELGFEIAQIRALLSLADHPEQPCANADQIAREHLGEIDAKIVRLQALRQEMTQMIEACPGDATARCRVIETIADHDQCLHETHR